MKYNALSILFILIVVLSWFMNIGWIRIIFVIPMIFHAILFYFSNRSFHRVKNNISNYANLISYSVYGTYLLSYILLPDGVDTEDSIRVFFGLIKNEKIINVASTVSGLSFTFNVITIIIQIIYTIKIKRNLRNPKINKE